MFYKTILTTLLLFSVTGKAVLSSQTFINIDPELLAAQEVQAQHGKIIPVKGDNETWFASDECKVKTSLKDLKDVVISFWVFPACDPVTGTISFSGKKEAKGTNISWPKNIPLLWGGVPGKIQTLKIILDTNGTVHANHLSWHNKTKWLEGVDSGDTRLMQGKWSHIAYGAGTKGQRLWINGKLVSRKDTQTQSISWPEYIKSGKLAGFMSQIKIQPEEKFSPAPLTPPDPDCFSPKKNLTGKLIRLLTVLPEYRKKLKDQKKQTPDMPYESARLKIINCLSVPILYNLLKETQQAPDQKADIYAVHRDEARWLLSALKEWNTQMDKIISGSTKPMQVPEIELDTSKLSIKKGSFWQNDRPVYFVGMFSSSYPLIDGTGLNLAGHTIGPKWEMPKENIMKNTGKGQRKRILNAAAHGYFWDILYSGHAFPDWAKKKYPHLKVGTGFMSHDAISSDGWNIHEKTLKSILPDLKGLKNLLSFDLANEPAFNGKTIDSAKNWRKWLEDKHKTIEELNKNWETEYKSFADIAVPGFVNTKPVSPGGQKFPVTEDKLRIYQDWSRFNLKRVNDWYAGINAIAKSYLPQTYTYTKMISTATSNARMGIDVLSNIRITDLLGSDSWWVHNGLDEGVAETDTMSGISKQKKSRHSVKWYSLLNYDLMSSAKPEAPATNGEFHLFSGPFKAMSEKNPEPAQGHWDRPVPWNHYYSGIWQQATHGVGLFAVWTHWPRNNIHQRPQAMDAVAKAAMDINRLSGEITALNNVKRPVGILWSLSSVLADKSGKWSANTSRSWAKIWKSVAINGVRPLFVFERDLVAGKLPQIKALIIYDVKNIDGRALEAIRKMKSRGVKLYTFATEHNLGFDPYYHPVDADARPEFDKVLSNEKFLENPYGTVHKLFAEENLLPEISVTAKNGEPTAIHWRAADYKGKKIINLCNYSRKPAEAVISGNSLPEFGTDKITGEKFNLKAVPLEVEQVRLLLID